MAVAVGLDDVDPVRHDRLRGFHGSHRQAVQALQDFHHAGIFTYTNMCLTRELVRSGDLWTYFEFVKDLRAGMIEMLEPRPCGGFASRGDDVLLTDADRVKVMEFFIRGNTGRKYRDYPLIYHVAFTEAPEQVGCTMGGLTHLAIDSKGNVNPCVFLPVTFGNILTEDFPAIYARMRKAIPRPLHRECPSIALADTLLQKSDGPDRFPVPHARIEKEWEEMFA
jgi:MoaA/NifB/PqqE/SkfB family radical SAM enzyme